MSSFFFLKKRKKYEIVLFSISSIACSWISQIQLIKAIDLMKLWSVLYVKD